MNYFNLFQYENLENYVISLNGTNTPKNAIEHYESTNWLFIIHMITNFSFIFPSMFLLDFKGLKLTCLIAICLTAISSWIKFASLLSEYYPILIFAQIICSIGHAFIQACLVKVTALWFGMKEVTKTLSVLN